MDNPPKKGKKKKTRAHAQKLDAKRLLENMTDFVLQGSYT